MADSPDQAKIPSGSLPLAGKRVVITRRREQSPELRGALVALGAEVVEIPTIEIRTPASWEPLDQAICRITEFDYLLLTSVNGVLSFLGRLRTCGRDVRDLAGLQIGAIGPATAAALAQAGVRVDFVPKEYRAEGLLESLSDHNVQGKTFLIPRAKVARDLVPRMLKGRGARVEVAEAYETVVSSLPQGEIERLLSPRPHVITFTSSSTVSNFAKLMGEERMHEALAGTVLASIGPVTSDTVRKLGLDVSIEAQPSTISGLVRSIREFFANPERRSTNDKRQ
jgi:uroporphyrinogen III methyltransferase/synthase